MEIWGEAEDNNITVKLDGEITSFMDQIETSLDHL